MTTRTPSRFRNDFLSSSSDEESIQGRVHALEDSSSDEENAQPRIMKGKERGEIGGLSSAMKNVKLNDQLLATSYRVSNRKNTSILLDSSSDDDDELVSYVPKFKPKTKPIVVDSSDDSSIEVVGSGATVSSPDSEEAIAEKYHWKLDNARNEYSVSSRLGSPMPNFRIPKHLFDSLYDHQKDGVAWMAGLHGGKERVGGLLGDDMGMGKTYQTLTFLGGLMRARTIRNALIVAPVSVLRSWEKEAHIVIKPCLANIRIMVISSDIARYSRKRYLNNALECSPTHPHLIITTYGLIGSSHMDFVHDSSEWDYVVLDEAQKIKNPAAQISKNIRRVSSGCEDTRRLILTGTPIMNNLRELWALFDFVTNGRLLGPAQRFNTQFQRPIEDARSKDSTKFQVKAGEKANVELQHLLKPFMLQRLKADYLADKLPTKSDLVIWTHLSSKQREMYSEYVESKDSAVADVLSGRSTSPLEAITWLKKLCGHPFLVEEKGVEEDIMQTMEPRELTKHSAKLQVLDALVKHLLNNGHRILIFSQSTKMLDVIQQVLRRVEGVQRIDGSTKEKDRQRFVDMFNDERGQIQIMLLSTKAAGIGLTLTGADRAIIYDPSWNPAEDSQAVDRCYRIGQTRAVTVYRFITAGTVEEKMYEKQVHKDGIRRAVVTSMGNSTARYFDKHDLSQVFKLNEIGKCDFLEKLRGRGLSKGNSGRGQFHSGVVGVSSHDILYTEETIDAMEDEEEPSKISDSQENPFSSPTKATNLTLHSAAENSEFPQKKLGRAQRILLRDSSGKEDSANLYSNPEDDFRKTPEVKSNEETTLVVDYNTPDTTAIFTKVDKLVSMGNREEALEILMNTMDKFYGEFEKAKKMQLHSRISSIAYDLQWL